MSSDDIKGTLCLTGCVNMNCITKIMSTIIPINYNILVACLIYTSKKYFYFYMFFIQWYILTEEEGSKEKKDKRKKDGETTLK